MTSAQIGVPKISPAQPRDAFRESLEIGRRLDYQMLLAYLLSAGGELARRAGEPDRAARLVGAATALFEAIGMEIPGEELGHEATTRLVAEGRLTAAADAIADAAALMESPSTGSGSKARCL